MNRGSLNETGYGLKNDSWNWVSFMKTKKALLEGMENISHSVAIINQQYCVLYSNRSFQKLFHYSQNCAKNGICDTLTDLQLEFNSGNQVPSPQEIHIPGSNKKYCIFIDFLDQPENGECHYLIHVKDKDSELLMKSSNPFISKEEIQVERLSPEFKTLIGKNIRFKLALIIAQRIAKSDLPVLIHGESGTGKEILARAIHESSLRKNNPLIDVNCAAIPDTLIESELFGYEKGAFTGANIGGRTGYFDQANMGTIFLDEIGDASLQMQSKLLRVLEDGSFKRVGVSKNIKVDTRIISATNKDLMKLIAEKKFREDLFYRLNAATIYIPPLRERPEDIELFIDHFLKFFTDKTKTELKFLPATMDILRSYQWPGNVRELKGVVNYVAHMTRGSDIVPNSLPSFFFSNPDKLDIHEVPTLSLLNGKEYNLSKVMDLCEKELIRNILSRSSSKSDALKILGISRRSFYIKLNKYGLK